MNFKSIKWRLQAWHGFLLVTLVVGLMSGFYTFERRARLQAVDTLLQGAITPLLPRLAPVGNGRREGGPQDREFRRPPPEGEEPPASGEDFPGPRPGGFRPRSVEGNFITPHGRQKIARAVFQPMRLHLSRWTNLSWQIHPAHSAPLGAIAN
jgi:hypothetical protein